MGRAPGRGVGVRFTVVRPPASEGTDRRTTRRHSRRGARPTPRLTHTHTRTHLVRVVRDGHRNRSSVTEVAQPDAAAVVDEYVLWPQIAVHDRAGVAVLDAAQDLC